MSVETAAGMNMPGGLLSGVAGTGGGRRMTLQLGSQRAADAPKAEHRVPPGLNMGAALPLVAPARARPARGERPKGRMLVYWGCGERVRAGQPAANAVSRRVSAPHPPAPGRDRTYGEWPNPQAPTNVPDNGSLRGEHAVKGNYSPEIRFVLGETHDFMEKVSLSASGNRLQWKALPTATGYFATLVGAAEGGQVVFWSSSEVQEMGSLLLDYVPPGEVARLIGEKVVMPPSSTECAVPAEVVRRAGGAPFLNFIAYGPEANFAHPQWAVKVRFKSTAQLLLGARQP